jgi:hypothetical protein
MIHARNSFQGAVMVIHEPTKGITGLHVSNSRPVTFGFAYCFNRWLIEVTICFVGCGKRNRINHKLQSHLRSDHWMSLYDYYRYFPDATKLCNKCKRELPITRFYIDQRKASGYRTQCIYCISPEGEKRECPLCHRVFQWSAIVNHLRKEHEILPIDAYRKYLKERHCPRCKTVKPLKDFYNKECWFFHALQDMLSIGTGNIQKTVEKCSTSVRNLS